MADRDDEKRGPDDDLIRQGPWTGVNEIDDERSLLPEELRAAVNVDLLKRGVARQRPGQTRRIVLTDPHSLWSDGETVLLVEAGELCAVDIDEWSLNVLQSGLSSTRHLSYTKAAGDIYWTNGEAHGRVRSGVAGAWGIPVPGRPVVSAASVGNMVAGRYLVALTFVSAVREESGSTLSQVVDVSDGGGIQLTNIPQSPEAAYVRVYHTKPNDQVLYRRIDIPMGTRSYAIGQGRLGATLKTQHAERAPPGQIARYFNGQMFIAVDNLVVRTLAHKYGLYVPDRDVWPFGARVTVMEPAGEGGLFIVAEKTYYVKQGENVDNRREVSKYGAVEGTGLQVPADIFGLEGVEGEVPVWVPKQAHAALAVGLPGGAIQYFGKDKIALADYGAGATLLREHDGLRTLVAALREKGMDDQMGAGDNASIAIYRNGVTV